jgi:heterodisulfide reductase subunit A
VPKEGREMSKSVLVIGGGIAGIQTSLDLAERGTKVYLVEKEPSIGGKMALLDKTFPTNDCAICILAPKMNECAAHPNIEILSYSEVIEVKGKVGDFTATILKKARFVDETKCTGCDNCAVKCPVKVPNKYNQNIDMRKAIYLPFPQSVPRVMTIDKEKCLYLTKGKCGLCKKICEAGAIDYEQKDEKIELKVGAVVIAIGFDVYNPSELTEYGYGKFKNVITALEYERLICASGPTGGHIGVGLKHREPKRIGFIQCVGSRDLKHNHPYCCSVCCLHATKEAILAVEHSLLGDIQTYIFYTDLRAPGKGFQEYIDRGKNDYDIQYIRAKPGRITENPHTLSLKIWYEDTIRRKLQKIEVDLVVLATTLTPTKGAENLAKILSIDLDQNGFFENLDPLLSPTDTSREGIFVCGYCESPKDIPESVAQASGAAARASEVIAMAENMGVPG